MCSRRTLQGDVTTSGVEWKVHDVTGKHDAAKTSNKRLRINVYANNFYSVLGIAKEYIISNHRIFLSFFFSFANIYDYDLN